MPKIHLNPYSLSKILKTKKNKKIVLVHGVFDLVHLGHIQYFNEAKKHGDILVVSLTGDKFVKKGINKPHYDQYQRSKVLSSLSAVDYVTISDDFHAAKVIQILKPNYYVKGPDYAKKEGDVAGNLKREVSVLKKNKGKFLTTSGEQFSSSKLINDYLIHDDFPKSNLIRKFKHKISQIKFLDDYKKTLKEVKNKKILVIGEVIFDQYNYVSPLGQPSKENILAVSSKKKEIYYGGVLPVIKNISQICSKIDFVTLYNNKKIKNQIKNFLGKKIKCNLFYNKDYIDIYKSRYVNINTFSKIFEVYNFQNDDIKNSLIEKFLLKNIKKYDHVIVCDFGHGLINKKLAEIISKKSKSLAINVQTNAGNRGFNLFTKYNKANFLCLDEPEFRLGFQDKTTNLKKLINRASKKYQDIMVTRGIYGLILKKKKKPIVELSALSRGGVDTMGAGDSAYSYASVFSKYCKNHKLVSLVAAIAGALKINIVGHRKFIDIDDIYKSIITLTK